MIRVTEASVSPELHATLQPDEPSHACLTTWKPVEAVAAWRWGLTRPEALLARAARRGSGCCPWVPRPCSEHALVVLLVLRALNRTYAPRFGTAVGGK